MAFTLQPPTPRPPRQPISFERARSRLVTNLRSELNRFIREDRDTRQIKRLSRSETVFIITYGTIEVPQAKVTCDRGEPLEREAERMFSEKASGILSALERLIDHASFEDIRAHHVVQRANPNGQGNA